MLVLMRDGHRLEEALNKLKLVCLDSLVWVFSVNFEELEGANFEVHHLLLLRRALNTPLLSA